MRVKDLIRQLQDSVDLWPQISEMPVTLEGQHFDMLIPCDHEGKGPVTCKEDAVGGIDLTDSGLTAEDYERHFG